MRQLTHQRQGDQTECVADGVTPRWARLLEGLIDLAARINAYHDIDSVIGAATEGARGLIGARHAAMSVVPDPKHPRPIHVVSNPQGHPQAWASPVANGPGFLAAL